MTLSHPQKATIERIPKCVLLLCVQSIPWLKKQRLNQGIEAKWSDF